MHKFKLACKKLKNKYKHGEGYIDTVVKIIACVLIGALVISGLVFLTNSSMNSAAVKVSTMFAQKYTYNGGSGGSGGGGAVLPGGGEGPTMLDGANQIYNKGLSTPLTFRSSAPMDTFKEVKVGGVTVDSSNYTVTEGSTIITFNEDYSKQLTDGDHSIDIVSTTGTASADFKVEWIAGLYDTNGNMTMTWDEIKATYPDAFSNGGKTIESNYVPYDETEPELGSYSESWFKSLSGVLVVSNQVKDIDDYAFAYCESLTSVSIPDSVTNIGEGAFAYCTLSSIKIPGSVANINDLTFSQCTGLTYVKFFDGVTSIGDGVFYDCTSLIGVIIPDSVTYIGDAFYNCENLCINCNSGSYAEEYANEKGIPHLPINYGL